MPDTKLIELAKKLKALADRGVGGEKDNAARMLKQLMAKHGISEADVNGKELHTYRCRIKNGDYKLFRQIVFNVVGKNVSVWTVQSSLYEITTDAASFMEIQFKFKFYLSAYRKEEQIFYKAFIMTNQLYVKQADGEELRSVDDLTPQEKEDWWKAQQMAGGLTKHHFHKQLKHK